MKIFISHALIDSELIENIKINLEPHSIDLLIAEHYVDMQNTISQKIEYMIKSCDVALFLLTENGFNSKFVHQEIGYMQSLKKPMLQLVQVGLEDKISGFIYGKDYIPYDPKKPELALNRTKKILLDYWRKAEQRKMRMEQLKINQIHQQNIEMAKLQETKRANEAKIGLGILAGLLVLAIATSD